MTVEITGGSAEVTVGQKIKLGIKFNVGWGALQSVEWTIPGTYVKDYDGDGQLKAKKTDLPAADLKKPTIEFYWVDGADGRSVKANCEFRASSGKTTKKEVTATFDVKAPTMDKFAAATDQVRLRPAPPAATQRISFGDPAIAHGIRWDWKITVPGTHDGYVKDVQTIKIDNVAVTTAGVKMVRAVPGTTKASPDYHLDTDNPYSLPGDYPPCPGFPHKIAKGGSFADTSTIDTPSNPVAGYKHLKIDRDFRYYIMYRPDTPGAIWVPVAKAEWNCHGEADLDPKTGKWALKGTSGGITSAGAATTEFPEFTSNSKLHAFVVEK